MLQKKIRVAVIVKEIELYEDNLIFIDELKNSDIESEDAHEILNKTKVAIDLKLIDLKNEMNDLIKDLKLNGVK